MYVCVWNVLEALEATSRSMYIYMFVCSCECLHTTNNSIQ